MEKQLTHLGEVYLLTKVSDQQLREMYSRDDVLASPCDYCDLLAQCTQFQPYAPCGDDPLAIFKHDTNAPLQFPFGSCGEY